MYALLPAMQGPAYELLKQVLDEMKEEYQISKVVKEVGSGLNDARPKFLALLEDSSMEVILVEHKDRASRFVVRYIEPYSHPGTHARSGQSG